MSWQKELDELNRRKEMAYKMGGAENIEKHHARGKLTARERIDLLIDKDTFTKLEQLPGKAEYNKQGKLKSFTHVPRVIGYGNINGRPVCVDGGDFTVRGGWADPTTFTAIGGFTPEKLAIERRIPFVRLLNAAGGSVMSIEAKGRTTLLGNPNQSATALALLSRIPVVSAALGSLGGYVPVSAAISHWNVMTKHTSELFVAGPPLVKEALNIDITKEDLGNYKVHAYQSGVIDNVAEDEEDAFRQIKTYLSYLPQNVWHQPPCSDTGDNPNRRDEELLSIIPRDRHKMYDIRQLIKHIFDKGSTFELAPFYGRSIVTMLARLNGYPVAVLSNDCHWFGGAQTAAGCEKMTRFIDFADTFHLPIIYLMDCPGFMIGPESEKEGIERKSARLIIALAQLTVPAICIIIRRCYGVAGGINGSLSQLNLRYAWPSAEWGSLPLEGGVMAAYRAEIEKAPDPQAKRREIEERLARLRSPFRTAEAFEIEEIIDPRNTRPLLCEFIDNAYEITATQLGVKSRIGIRP